MLTQIVYFRYQQFLIPNYFPSDAIQAIERQNDFGICSEYVFEHCQEHVFKNSKPNPLKLFNGITNYAYNPYIWSMEHVIWKFGRLFFLHNKHIDGMCVAGIKMWRPSIKINSFFAHYTWSTKWLKKSIWYLLFVWITLTSITLQICLI